ncbi:MAG TPA: hypothetical protein VMX55_06325 [candidate division Zixibacteria bacterium]|nr:hypothetical protein [candidate division Zixibacteria bacterium]
MVEFTGDWITLSGLVIIIIVCTLVVAFLILDILLERFSVRKSKKGLN